MAKNKTKGGNKLSLTAPKGKAPLAETEFTPEENASPGANDVSDYEKKARMFHASCAREIDRISHENGVRIGDTILNEAKAVELVGNALEELRQYYESMFQIP
jgi:hypothetical protein